MDETISRIVSSSSTTRMRSYGMALCECMGHFRPGCHIPKVTKWRRKSNAWERRSLILEGLGIRASIDGSYGAVGANRGRFSYLADGKGDRCPQRGGGQPSFLPRVSKKISACLGSRLDRVYGISLFVAR